MKMNKFLKLLVAVLFVAISFSCKKDPQPLGKNYLKLDVVGESSITEDSKEPITVNVTLSRNVEKDVTINFELEGNTGDILRIEGAPLVIKQGGLSGKIQVFSNNKGLLNVTKNIVLKLKDADCPNIQAYEKSTIIIPVKPNKNIPELTTAQVALIEGYKTNLKIDLYKMLGELTCNVKITFPTDEKDLFNDGKDTKSFTGKTIITLSEKSTADTPILKMVDNPMGLNSFLYDMLKKETTQDVNESWYDQPYPKAVISAIQYDANKETFSSVLDSLIILKDNKIQFVSSRTGYSSGSTVSVVPFDFSYSAWTRLLQKAEAGEDAVVDDGDTQTEYSLSDIVMGGGSLDPYDYLFITDISSDGWENEPSDWFEPTGKYDFAKGTFAFTFPFDHTNASGYSKIEVTYTMK